MLLNQMVKVRWNTRSKKWYESKGYTFTRYGDYFYADICHLTKGSDKMVSYSCDYCGKRGEKRYYSLISNRKVIDKDCCNDRECMGYKQVEVFMVNLIKKQGSLADNFPHLIPEWSTKNDKSPHEYTSGSNHKAIWKCEEGHEWNAEIHRRTKLASGCPYCAGQRASSDKNIETLKPELVKEWSDKNSKSFLEFLPYSNKSAWWQCEEGHTWETLIYNRTLGHGCPICKSSKGERKVKNYLDNIGITYTQQFYFTDLIGVGGITLKFDFAVVDSSGKVLYLIEYDGEFHYKKQYEEDGFETLKIHDKMKDDYCKEKGIQLLRIPYYEADNIATIIDEYHGSAALSGFNF